MDEILRQVIARTGYGRMLESDNDPESESRLANLATGDEEGVQVR